MKGLKASFDRDPQKYSTTIIVQNAVQLSAIYIAV